MKVLFATSNHHKIMEANEVGKEFNVEFIQLMEDYPEIRDEDVSNVAKDGAEYVFDKIQKPLIVEDTGMFIETLDGFPGSYSAFVFNKIGNEGILRLMTGKANRTAKFVSAIGYCNSNGVQIFKGSVEGIITDEPIGNSGFGYDSIFMPHGEKKTFAQDPKMKYIISHRRKAFETFCKWLTSESSHQPPV